MTEISQEKILRVKTTRSVHARDPVWLARCRSAPELGPKALFFSGGTALRSLSRTLVGYTHNSIHLITPFDSGGSSAIIRQAFNMPAVGDIRNRIMAMADMSARGNHEIFQLFSHRFPREAPREQLRGELREMIEGGHPLVSGISDPMRKVIRGHLRFFYESMPGTFDLRGASIGNLILAGGYFNYGRHLDPVIYIFSKLVEVRGVVRPIVNEDLYLIARLESGQTLIGQHLFTGKETAPTTSPIKEVYLANKNDYKKSVKIKIRAKTRKLIREADLICYPMGSFYSSIIANLLPEGVGESISLNDCPKVYVPNAGTDPELFGTSLYQSVEILLNYLKKDLDSNIDIRKLIDFVLIDSASEAYPTSLEVERIRRLGITIVDAPLVTRESRPYFDPERVIEHLLSLR